MSQGRVVQMWQELLVRTWPVFPVVAMLPVPHPSLRHHLPDTGQTR